MNQLAPGIYSKHSLEYVVEKLKAGNKHNQLNISDFDGTVFKGTTGHFLQGMSIAYLSLYTLPSLISKPKQLTQFIKNNIMLGSDIIKAGKIEEPHFRTLLEEIITLNYCNKVLKDLPIEKIEKNAQKLMKHIYHHSTDIFAYFANRSYHSILITKTIEPVIKAYTDYLNSEYQTDITYYANKLETTKGIIKGISPAGQVTTCYDKAERLQLELEINSHIKYAIITGDTNEDIKMFEVADELLGKDNCLKIANHPKDKKIKDEADLIVYKSKNLKKLIDCYVPIILKSPNFVITNKQKIEPKKYKPLELYNK